MTALANTARISSPLEDYPETIYLLVQAHGFARVRDIARARDVKAATVSVALRRLAEGRLVNHERREHIGLTPRGEEAARRQRLLDMGILPGTAVVAHHPGGHPVPLRGSSWTPSSRSSS